MTIEPIAPTARLAAAKNDSKISGMQLTHDKTWKLTILMVTYNHEKFIRQTVESVVSQQTSFDFQLVIGEDCSTDRTREICLQLKEEYPDKITLVLNETNLGVAKNACQLYRFCLDHSSGYMAILDGDDYWTDPLKLQKQYELMERMPDISLCFHPCTVSHQSGLMEPTNKDDRERRVTIQEIIERGWFIMTCSIFIRKEMFEFPDWFEEFAIIGDNAVHMLCTDKGDAYFIEDNMGVYRKHGGGLTDAFFNVEMLGDLNGRLLKKFDRFTKRRHTKLIVKKMRQHYDRVVEEIAYRILQKSPFHSEYWSDYLRIYKYCNFRNKMHLKYLLHYLLINPIGKALSVR